MFNLSNMKQIVLSFFCFLCLSCHHTSHGIMPLMQPPVSSLLRTKRGALFSSMELLRNLSWNSAQAHSPSGK